MNFRRKYPPVQQCFGCKLINSDDYAGIDSAFHLCIANFLAPPPFGVIKYSHRQNKKAGNQVVHRSQ